MSRLSNSSGVPTLCYVTDRSSLPGVQTAGATAALRCIVAAAAAAGVDWIQIREKNLSGGDCVLLTREALQLAASATPSDATPTRILVNDRLDVALSEAAGGVHLGEKSLPIQEARSEEHTSELQSLAYLVCRLLLEKKKKKTSNIIRLE